MRDRLGDSEALSFYLANNFQKTTCPLTLSDRDYVASDSKIRRNAQFSDNGAGRLKS